MLLRHDGEHGIVRRLVAGLRRSRSRLRRHAAVHHPSVHVSPRPVFARLGQGCLLRNPRVTGSVAVRLFVPRPAIPPRLIHRLGNPARFRLPAVRFIRRRGGCAFGRIESVPSFVMAHPLAFHGAPPSTSEAASRHDSHLRQTLAAKVRDQDNASRSGQAGFALSHWRMRTRSHGTRRSARHISFHSSTRPSPTRSRRARVLRSATTPGVRRPCRLRHADARASHDPGHYCESAGDARPQTC